jgi:cysteine desulfurase / selenocysteine lyase
MRIDPRLIKASFPIFAAQVRGGHDLVYLDNGATTQKPKPVIEAEHEFYSHDYGTVHRGIYHLSAIATKQYEAARETVADFINSRLTREIIFTRGATESINIVARTFGDRFIGNGDEILLSEFEHHSNLVPWLMLQERTGAQLVYVRSTSDWRLDMADFRAKLSPRTKLVAISGMSNVLGTMTDVDEICELAHKFGAKVLVDGAQLVPHYGFDVRKTGCDFLAFSSHKMLGPTGVGILYMREEIAESLPPLFGGGDMIESVRYDGFTANELPYKFEAGTPNIAGVITFAKAIEFLQMIGMTNIIEHEREITEYSLDRLLSVDGLRLYGPETPHQRGALFSFNYKDIHSHDVASILDFENIAVRAGHHCAQPLMGRLGVNSTVRASFYVYNSRNEIDILIDSLKQCERFLKNAVR